MASVLAVVAGAPAQAANTSSEALEADGSREFGGIDRYDTANRLAKNFGEAKGLGNVPVAFVASGYTLVDAVAVAGLAGFYDAPVLLTPMDSLNAGVANFIEDYGVQTVHVLGGSAAVADSVVEAMEALANKPTVTRELAGADGGSETAAILANGGDVSLAYAMLSGTVAHRLQLPLLLTAADMLPDATADFITDQRIREVVIVGGTSSVSEDVANALTTAGVDSVKRVDGDTPGAASAELAKLISNGCGADLGLVSGDTVALVAESGLPDGVAAAPVLTSTYANGDLVPMLVVDDTLPAEVRDYLAGTPKATSAGAKLNLSIVAVGGTAAVTADVMTAALAAAASADALAAQIGNGGVDDNDNATEDRKDTNGDGKIDGNDLPAAGDDKIVLYFTDNVVSNLADTSVTPNIPANRLLNLVRDNLMINGAPARLAAVSEPVVHGTGTDANCDPDTATVHLLSKLKAGDVIALADGAKFGDSKDGRKVAGVSVTVPAAKADTTAPTVSVVAIASGTGLNNQVAKVSFSDNDGGSGLADTEQVTTDNVATDTKGDEIKITSSTANQAVNGGLTLASGGDITFAQALVAGDRITITSGAVTDKAGNKSRARTFNVIAAQPSPRITAVTMSNLNHTVQSTINVHRDISGATSAATDITITAKKGGAADGAVGNGWNMVFDVATGWKDDAKAAVDIDVSVNSKDKSVWVRFNTGKAKFADLKAALEGNSAFDAMFEVKLPTDSTGGCGATANNPLALTSDDRQETTTTTGGTTMFAVEVRFNHYVDTVVDDNLLADILQATLDRAKAAADTTTLANVRTALGLTSPAAVASFPVMSRRYEATTTNAGMIPMVRDLVTTAKGTSNSDEVAGGYAADVTATTDVFEDRNAASQVRIGQSSSVKAPKPTA